MGRNGIINNDILDILYKSIKTGLLKRAIPQGFSSTKAKSHSRIRGLAMKFIVILKNGNIKKIYVKKRLRGLAKPLCFIKKVHHKI